MYKNEYLPELSAPLSAQDQSIEALRAAMTAERVLTGIAVRCSGRRDLIVRFCGCEGRIPREEAIHPSISGADRDIAILSRVGRPVSFVIKAIPVDSNGRPHPILSRRKAQEKAISLLLENAQPGTVLPARIVHLDPFGAFVDLGCGVLSMLPLEHISVSRIHHAKDRFRADQKIFVVVRSADPERKRFYISHKELLGTWLQNAENFSPGEVVTGIVRGVREYGAFVELAPNLSGLADPVVGLADGDRVSVYIKAIQPGKRKIKLQVVENLGPAEAPDPIRYFITEGQVKNWKY